LRFGGGFATDEERKQGWRQAFEDDLKWHE